MLNKETFIEIIRHTPLVSIDLIVSRNDGQVLLGHRLNEPACGFWFVPGGRILKNETLADAFSRICLLELGHTYALSDANLLGVYEHFYQENFAGIDNVSTHYVVLAQQLTLSHTSDILPDQQHDDYRWFHPSDIVNNPDVHKYTRAYFI